MPISQLSHWDNVGTEPGAGDAEYTAGQQPIAEHDNWFNWSAAKDVENLIAALENITTGHDHDGANSKQVDGSDVVNTPAGNVAATDVQAAINELDTEKSLIANITDMDEQSFTNLLKNGDFESWSAGTSTAPDGWNVGGAGALIVRDGAIKKIETYSSKVTRVGNDCTLYQSILDYTRYQSRVVTLGCWVYSTNSDDEVGIAIQDSVGYSTIIYHTGDSSWQWLTVTKTIDNAAASMKVHCKLDGIDGSGYFDGAILVEGSVCPAFSPKPITNSNLKFRDITSVAVNTTLTDSHYTVGVDASGAARTIALPAAAVNTGRIYNISKRDSSANTVTIDANAAELINGVATVVISTQYDSYTIQSDGTGWWIT